jgi:hypothetical protein
MRGTIRAAQRRQTRAPGWLAACACLSLLVGLALLAGCDSLADSDYVGQPLFTLSGSFAEGANAPAGPVAGVALFWQDAHGAGGPGIAATAVPVSVAFPAAFSVAIPAPPPEAARFGFGDGVMIAEAYVYMVGDVHAPRQTPLGSDRTHVIVWASADVAAGTPAADYLGGPITAGYHLRHFALATTVGAAQAQLIDACAATGARRSACATRRAYQLQPIIDEDRLRIEVAHR